ncbi:MAG: hypothetical protein QXW97_03060 [Candidatus Pacearchaeota archaeon]
MKNRLSRYFDEWCNLKNESVIEEEIDDEGANFDQLYEENEIELD